MAGPRPAAPCHAQECDAAHKARAPPPSPRKTLIDFDAAAALGILPSLDARAVRPAAHGPMGGFLANNERKIEK
ncbi:hypothetical protein OF001_U320009 [Pseudomonas sp. OF001]|nr:hypothetical protein OF001_U320009 [Pseudomonas sp. OF001]